MPSLAGPKRPQDRINLPDVKKNFLDGLGAAPKTADIKMNGTGATIQDGSVVIAAITSCTNTSNPSVLVAAGLVAKKAVERGLTSKPWVKTSLAPGSKVVMDYLREAGLLPALEALKFNLVGYGCTTCIGNSGPLPEEVAAGVTKEKLTVAAVLSGNRNFEGRVNPLVKANYLASPPLGCRLRHRGPRRHGSHARAPRPGPVRQRCFSARHLAFQSRSPGSGEEERPPRDVRETICGSIRGRCGLARHESSGGRSLRLG